MSDERGFGAVSSGDSLASLAVLVVNFGSHQLVAYNLGRSLGAGFPGQVIVADNFSTHEERDRMKSVCSERGWGFLALPENIGFGEANNRAAERAIRNGATELLLVNPDAWLPLSAIESLQRQVRDDPNLQLAPVVLRPDDRLYSAEMDLHLEIGEMRSVRRRPPDTAASAVHTWVSGACFAISAQLWQRVGGFAGDYFLYWEDVDLSRRIVAAGGSVRVDAALKAYHDEGGTHRDGSSDRAKSATYYYYNARNRLVYAALHLGPEDRRRWLRTTPKASYRILLQGGRRQLVSPLKTFLPAIRGSIAGLRGYRTIRKRIGEAETTARDTTSFARIRVMQSFGAPLPTTNPYITMLDRALSEAPGIEHLRFSWSRALFGRYDVFQWHWPEAKLHGTARWKSVVRLLLVALISARHSVSRRIAVVRTVHNIELPDDTRARLWLLRRIDRQTDFRIVLNATTPLPEGTPYKLILHGHYRDWYGSISRADPVPGRLGTFGGVRRYKGVESLVETYAEAVRLDESLTLHIGGNPSTSDLQERLTARSEGLPGLLLTLRFLSDEELVQLATSSELVVLAYTFMHNSGSVLAALSLDRPVLVPRHAPNEALADEVGADWVQMYDGELRAERLVEACRNAAMLTGAPDLSRREWADAGSTHEEAFRAAIAIKRGASVSADCAHQTGRR